MTERREVTTTNGRNQAVRIPRELELPGEDAVMRKEGDRLIIETVPPRSLLATLLPCLRVARARLGAACNEGCDAVEHDLEPGPDAVLRVIAAFGSATWLLR